MPTPPCEPRRRSARARLSAARRPPRPCAPVPPRREPLLALGFRRAGLRLGGAGALLGLFACRSASRSRSSAAPAASSRPRSVASRSRCSISCAPAASRCATAARASASCSRRPSSAACTGRGLRRLALGLAQPRFELRRGRGGIASARLGALGRPSAERRRPSISLIAAADSCFERSRSCSSAMISSIARCSASCAADSAATPDPLQVSPGPSPGTSGRSGLGRDRRLGPARGGVRPSVAELLADLRVRLHALLSVHGGHALRGRLGLLLLAAPAEQPTSWHQRGVFRKRAPRVNPFLRR